MAKWKEGGGLKRGNSWHLVGRTGELDRTGVPGTGTIKIVRQDSCREQRSAGSQWRAAGGARGPEQHTETQSIFCLILANSEFFRNVTQI